MTRVVRTGVAIVTDNCRGNASSGIRIACGRITRVGCLTCDRCGILTLVTSNLSVDTSRNFVASIGGTSIIVIAISSLELASIVDVARIYGACVVVIARDIGILTSCRIVARIGGASIVVVAV